jgi:hypothetical protein
MHCSSRTRPFFLPVQPSDPSPWPAVWGSGSCVHLTPFEELARQTATYRQHLEETSQRLRSNPARGKIDVARWTYVAETDAKARAESEAGIMRHLQHFASGHTSGYLGTVSQGGATSQRDTTCSPATSSCRLAPTVVEDRAPA